MGRFSDLTRAELQDVVQNPKSTMLEIMVASVMAQAAKTGDAARLAFLLDRSIGRVKEVKSDEEHRALLEELKAMSTAELLERAKAAIPALEAEATEKKVG